MQDIQNLKGNMITINLIQQTSQMESNIKAENALEWTGCLNNIRVYAGKIVERELIYT